MRSVAASSQQHGVQSIDRAMHLLRLVAAEHGNGLALADLVAQSELERTTVYRIIYALERSGLVQRHGRSTRYSLGLEAVALGAQAMCQSPLVQQCRPAMLAIARRSGEPVFLVLRMGDYSYCLHLESPDNAVRSFASIVGSTRLLGLGIPSLALLARLPDTAIQSHYERHQAVYHERGLTYSTLQRWVLQTQTQGFAQVSARGLAGVGVTLPVGSCGEAAFGVVTLRSRLPRTQGANLAALIHEELIRL